MKKLITLLFVLFCFSGFGQVYQLMPQYGYQANRFRFDSTLQIPTVCGVPTLKSNVTKLGAIAFDSCNNRFYTYNPKTATWSQVSGGGGSTDTTFLSARIDARVKYTDTASMLSPYLRKTDTANAFVNSVTKLNDSTIQVIKGNTTSNITLNTSSIVTSATRLVTTVYNSTGATIPKGSVVYISGRHNSNLATVAPAQANNEENSYKTFALVENDITNNNSGTVIQAGSITGLSLPTSSYTDGDIVYLSPTVAGGITTTKPLAPYHICKIGSITRAHPSAGSIEIKIENGWQLDELSDVSIPLVPADSVVLQFSRVDSLWHDVTISNAIGTRYVKPTDTSTMLTPYLRRSLSTNDTIKTNAKVLQINAKTLTKSSILKIDTTGLNGSVNLSGNTAALTLSPTYNFFGQLNGANEDYIQTQSGETTIASIDATNTDGLTINSGIGLFWYTGVNDTIGILPRTNGTSGQVLKLQNGAQMVWANDSSGSVDTASLSSRINTKLNISDTSVFDRKLIPANSFLANNTAAPANSVATAFKDTSGTYTGTIAWTGTTAPSGATNHSYRWTRIGKQVTLNVNLVYATNGGALTALVFDLPGDCPTPSEPSGLTAASQNMYPVLMWTSTSTNTLSAASQRGFLRNNSGNNGYEIVCNFTTHACNSSYVTLTYWTN